MYLSVFSDELFQDVSLALPKIKSWGCEYADFRGLIHGKGVEYQTGEDLKGLKKTMDNLGLKTGALQSSLCKIHLPGRDKQKEELEKLEGLIRAADILGCRLVRSFNYWQVHEGMETGLLAVRPDEMNKVLELFDPVAKRAKEAGLVLGFENCGQTAGEVIALLHALNVPGWGLAWDPHNDVEIESLALDPENCDDYYEHCINYTVMVHVKAATLIPDLEGKKLPWDRILKGVSALGREIPVSIETHNPAGSGYTHEDATKKTFELTRNAWPAGVPSSVRDGLKKPRDFIRPYGDDPVRFVVAGLGMGSLRAKQLTETSGCMLYGVVDIDGEKARKTGEALGVPYSTDITKFLKDPKVEVVYVVTPTGLHAEVAVPCLEAGKHVLTTKPMDANTENCRRMIDLAKQKNLLLGVDFDLRQDEQNLSLKKAVEAGWFGTLLSAYDSLVVQRLDDYYRENGGWRGTRKLDGGAAMSNQGIHEIDRLQFLCGIPRRVRATAKTLVRGIECEDIGAAEWDYDSGMMVRFYATTTYPLPAWDVRFEMHGTEGAFILGSGGPGKQGAFYGKDGKWTGTAPYPVERKFRQGSDAFAFALRTGEPLPASGEEGIKSRLILDAMYESAKNDGQWIKVE
ncbi:MAG: Gfo/Idh/MocA family oxidoreductase [Treponema sp.]|jgi:predicted dehydrogenase/sugar phosphate isomerase/epimerase|nr:Gfo/Idh/MocA family oxidoreductase [Treponema sp.]